jgi:hypothetical protein
VIKYQIKFLVIILLCLPLSAKAQQVRQIGANLFEVGVNQNEINYLFSTNANAGKQIQSQWCWAASIQMVLNYHGLQVKQAQLVEKLFGGRQVNQAVNANQILSALRGWHPNSDGQLQQVFSQEIAFSELAIITALSYKWPLLAGLNNGNSGHAMVLIGARYSIAPDGHIQISQLSFIDPLPTAPPIVQLSGNAFRQKCTALIKILVIR